MSAFTVGAARPLNYWMTRRAVTVGRRTVGAIHERTAAGVRLTRERAAIAHCDECLWYGPATVVGKFPTLEAAALALHAHMVERHDIGARAPLVTVDIRGKVGAPA